MFKKSVLIAVCLILLVGLFVREGYCETSENGKFINVYSWGEFISNGVDGNLDVNRKFEEETGIRVNYKTFQNNEELFAKIISGGADYDVIIPSDYMISRLIENDMLSEIDFENIPNYSIIDDKFKNLKFDFENKYSVPYMWGVVGLFYNSKYVSEREENITWDILWDSKYKNKILMFDNARDSFAVSLLRLGYSVNSDNPNEWKKAAEELIIQKPIVQAYVMDQIFDKIGNGEAWIAPYYAGDAVIMMKNNSDIRFVVPKAGTNLFVDSMCIPKNSKNKKLAEKYINFMCRTDIAYANVKQTGYSTPQVEVFNLLDDEIKNNKIYYPDVDTMNNAQIFVNLPSDINKLMDELWVEVKAGGTVGEPWILILILIIFVLIYVIFSSWKKRKYKT